jgi:hypothetical protein
LKAEGQENRENLSNPDFQPSDEKMKAWKKKQINIHRL